MNEPAPAPRPSEPRLRLSEPDPDEQAMQLVVRLVQRVEVARSFTKICAGIVQAQFATAAQALLASDVARVAKAASEVAIDLARAEVKKAGAVAGAAANVAADVIAAAAAPREGRTPESLDHESLHDDAC